MTSERYLNPKEAVEYVRSRGVNCSVATLASWRHSGKTGPRFRRIAGRVYYAVEDVNAFIDGAEDHATEAE